MIRSRAAAATAFAAGVCLGLNGCASNPATGGADFVLMTAAQEVELGRANDPKIRARYGVYNNAGLQAYVRRVGEHVALHSDRPKLDYHFTVLDTQDVNAFALPGGYIYITRGILAYLNSEAELAAVLGHEVGHVSARHAVRQYSAATAGQILVSLLLRSPAGQDLFNVIGGALLSGYGRDHELEADRLGAEYIARAGYDPEAMIGVIGVLKNQEEFEKQRAAAEKREARIYHGVFATHPSADQRLQEVVAEARTLKNGTGARLGRDEYLDHIDGLVYGDSPSAGISRGSGFYHRGLDVAIQFPPGWLLENAADSVTARRADGNAVMRLLVSKPDRQAAPEAYLKARLKVDRLADGAALAGTTFASFSGIAPLNTPYGRRNARVTAILRDNRAYLFLAAARTDALSAALDDAFLAAARSLHPLTAPERAIAAGRRLHVVPAGPGQTFAQLAHRSPITTDAESVLRLLNDKFPRGEPTPGGKIKIIR